VTLKVDLFGPRKLAQVAKNGQSPVALVSGQFFLKQSNYVATLSDERDFFASAGAEEEQQQVLRLTVWPNVLSKESEKIAQILLTVLKLRHLY